MSIDVTEIIKDYRLDKKLTLKQLYGGLCSISTASRFEDGTRKPDILLALAILDRAGISSRLLCFYVSSIQAEYLKWKKNIINSIIFHDDETFRKLLPKSNQLSSGNSVIQEQFVYYLWAIDSEKNGDYKEAFYNYKEALKLTNSSLVENNKITCMIGKFEIILYSSMINAHLHFDRDSTNLYNNAIYQIFLQVNTYYKNKRELSSAVACLAYIYYLLVGRTAMSKNILLYAYNLLIEQKNLFHLVEIMQGLTEDEEGNLYKNYAVALKDLYIRFCGGYEFEPYEIPADMCNMVCINEYLKSGRIRKKYTQIELSDGIIETENYSRIECGNSNPSIKKYKALANKLGIENRSVCDIVTTSNYSIIELANEVLKSVSTGDISKAVDCLNVFYCKAEQNTYNHQFYNVYKGYCEYMKGIVCKEELLDILKESLAQSMDVEEIGKKTHIYTRLEIMTINIIAHLLECDKKYHEALSLLLSVYEDVDSSFLGIDGRIEDCYTLILNLVKLFSDVCKYDRAYDIGEIFIKNSLAKKEAFLLSDILMEQLYNLDMMLKDSSFYKKMVPIIGRLFEEKSTLKVYEDYYSN